MGKATTAEMIDGPGAYVIRCVANGKVYVGSSSKSVLARKSQHFSKLRCGSHYSKAMQNDFTRHGEESFEFYVVQFVEDGTHIQLEQELIDKHDATNREKGYNSCPKAGVGGMPGNGRPAPLGRKVPIGIRVTPDVLAYCKQHEEGFVLLETLVRQSEEFQHWMASR